MTTDPFLLLIILGLAAAVVALWRRLSRWERFARQLTLAVLIRAEPGEQLAAVVEVLTESEDNEQ